MAYCTQGNVEVAVGGSAALVQLADLEELGAGAGAAAIAVNVASAIAAADGFINSYLRQRFATPLAVVAPELVDLSAAWAARILRRRRYKGQPLTDDQEAEKIDREWLDAVAHGTIQLSQEPSPIPSDIIVDKVALRDTTLSVSKEKLKGFI